MYTRKTFETECRIIHGINWTPDKTFFFRKRPFWGKTTFFFLFLEKPQLSTFCELLPCPHWWPIPGSAQEWTPEHSWFGAQLREPGGCQFLFTIFFGAKNTFTQKACILCRRAAHLLMISLCNVSAGKIDRIYFLLLPQVLCTREIKFSVGTKAYTYAGGRSKTEREGVQGHCSLSLSSGKDPGLGQEGDNQETVFHASHASFV